MKYILLISSLLFISTPAFSQAIIGGGCMLEGDLCEEDDYSRLGRLDIREQLASLQNHTKQLPGLSKYLNLLSLKEWYLEDRPFNKVLCGPQGMSEEASANYEIVACQIAAEVRISTKFWTKATAEQKNKLVLHELMLSWAIKKGLTTQHMRRATHLILNQMKEPIFIRNKLADMEMPFFNILAEDETIIKFAQRNKEIFKKETAQEEIEKKWSEVSLHSFFRMDYTEMALSIFQNTIENAKHDGYLTLNDAYLASFISKELRSWEIK